MIDKDKHGDGRRNQNEFYSKNFEAFLFLFFKFSRTHEMNLTIQTAEEKRKQLLTKEMTIKRNLSSVRRETIFLHGISLFF